MLLNEHLQELADNELAGANTINPIIAFLRNIRSLTPLIDINPNASGGMDVDFDQEAIEAYIHDIKGMSHSFTASISGTVVAISGGNVWLADRRLSCPSASFPLGADIYVRCTSSSASLSSGSVAQTYDIDNQTVNLPLLSTSTDADGNIAIQYRHLGDFILPTPFFWLPGYDPTAAEGQVMTHKAGALTWITMATCETEA